MPADCIDETLNIVKLKTAQGELMYSKSLADINKMYWTLSDAQRLRIAEWALARNCTIADVLTPMHYDYGDGRNSDIIGWLPMGLYGLLTEAGSSHT